MAENTELIERLAVKLLRNMEQRLDEGGSIEIKDYKAVTGALKELKELGRLEEKASGRDCLTVRFVGEAEDMAR